LTAPAFTPDEPRQKRSKTEHGGAVTYLDKTLKEFDLKKAVWTPNLQSHAEMLRLDRAAYKERN
jgi:hypothetical protein